MSKSLALPKLRAPWIGPLLAVALLFALFAILAHETFASTSTVVTMLRQTTVVGIAAVGMTMIIVLGGIDLSVGSAVALTTVSVALCLRAGQGPWVAALVGIATAAACGAINGLLVGYLKFVPFIATLGTMSLLRGLCKGLADEQKIDAEPHGLESLLAPLPDGREWMLLPTGVWITVLLAVVVAVLLRTTQAGRYVFAVGSSEPAARLCGIDVAKVKFGVFALAGVLVGWAGVLEFSRLTVGDPTDSVGLELDVIAAVVIGGGSLSGGEGSVLGSVLGALLMTIIKTGCTHVGLPNWVQEILTGVIIVVAVGLDRIRHRKGA
ncbi:ABC transporter permease [Pendulispora albinea]|uniref:ABC transporter permease n=1 Tax=Pendulispora albinea TaxID=2741071 RepID=A0ABZ2LN78_9BACT